MGTSTAAPASVHKTATRAVENPCRSRVPRRRAPTAPRSNQTTTAATDAPIAALLDDLRERGLLDDTLVVWGGEFGRTVYCQRANITTWKLQRLNRETIGRDHDFAVVEIGTHKAIVDSIIKST